MPAELLRGIIGGLYQVIYGRLRERREAELPDLVPGLWEWTMSFPPPPRPLRRPGRLIVSRPIPTAPPFASYSAEQRIIRGFAVAVAAKGYPATTIADIAAAASISQTTFYEHFDGKAEALARGARIERRPDARRGLAGDQTDDRLEGRRCGSASRSSAASSPPSPPSPPCAASTSTAPARGRWAAATTPGR